MKKWILLLSFFGLFSVFLGSSYYIGPQKTAQAACGASTSSCKTCHEVKGEDPVSKKGDWHVQHAFGDFCQACHLGVATEDDKTKAHAGVIFKPLAQSDQSCSSCHPSDTATRVTKYSGSVSSTAPAGATNTGTPSPIGGNNPADSAGSTAPSAAATHLIEQDKTPWLAWAIGIIDVFVLFILGILLLRWKKGLWLWSLFRGKEK